MSTEHPQPFGRYESLGECCRMLRCTPTTLNRAAEVLRIEPALLLNSVPYYTEADIEKLRQHLANQPTRRKAGATR